MVKKGQRVKKQVVKIDGIRIGYSEVGSGEPLVLIHGDKYFWETFIPTLVNTNNNVRLLTISPPGYGALKNLEKINSLKKFSFLLDKLFVKLNLASFNLAGQSLGSIIALLYASKHPEKIKRLILISPPFSVLGRKRAKALEKLLSLSLQLEPLYKINSRLHKTRFLNYWAIKIGGFYHFNKEIFEKIILPAAQECNERPAIANTVSMLKVNHLPLLRQVKSPKAIIIGDHDPVISVPDAKRISKNLPNCQLFIIPFAKHGIMLEKPKELSQAIVSSLKP